MVGLSLRSTKRFIDQYYLEGRIGSKKSRKVFKNYLNNGLKPTKSIFRLKIVKY